MTRRDPVCVLVATLASSDRAPYVLRAIDSLRAQSKVYARPIVVVNGEMADPAVVGNLEQDRDITVLYRPEANLPRALAAGRRLVDTPFFAQLDDDDELLPNALELRLQRMMQLDKPDAVVTNGLIRAGSLETESMADFPLVERDPMRTLMERNWMLPGSALFRTETLSEAVFEATPRFLEWTYIGLLLASRYRLALLSSPTVIHYDDHAFSVNQSRECTLGRPHAFEAVLALDLPAEVKRQLRVKRGAAWHQAAQAAATGDRTGSAWAAHLRSLTAPGGWRYISYTRHLLRKQQAKCSTAAQLTTSRESGPPS